MLSDVTFINIVLYKK